VDLLNGRRVVRRHLSRRPIRWSGQAAFSRPRDLNGGASEMSAHATRRMRPTHGLAIAAPRRLVATRALARLAPIVATARNADRRRRLPLGDQEHHRPNRSHRADTDTLNSNFDDAHNERQGGASEVAFYLPATNAWEGDAAGLEASLSVSGWYISAKRRSESVESLPADGQRSWA
jgi:hypothetical protein